MADGTQPDTGTGLNPETADVNHWVPGTGKYTGSAIKTAESVKWKGFSKGQLKTHYEKHVLKQKEFGDISQAEYLKRAKEFAKELGNFKEANVGNFIIKYDPESGRILVGHSKSREIRTFYKDDGRDADPFQAAIDFAKGL